MELNALGYWILKGNVVIYKILNYILSDSKSHFNTDDSKKVTIYFLHNLIFKKIKYRN